MTNSSDLALILLALNFVAGINWCLAAVALTGDGPLPASTAGISCGAALCSTKLFTLLSSFDRPILSSANGSNRSGNSYPGAP